MVLFGLVSINSVRHKHGGKKSRIFYFFKLDNNLWIIILLPGPVKEKYLTVLIVVLLSFTLDTAAMTELKVHHCFSIQ